MIPRLRSYPAYKDSGVEWLGKVPEHWSVIRGKWLFNCIDVRSTSGDEELLTVSSERGVIPRSDATVTMFKAESYKGYKLCWLGDLVINSLWAWARGLGVSQHHGIVSSAYGVYRLKKTYREYAGFIHRLVRSSPFNYELHVRSKGIWVSRLQLTDEAFLGAPIPLPDRSEQSAIIRFLSHANCRIQRYIHTKQKLLSVLEEQKQAIIHQAVTGQIDVRTGKPYPAYKPSGVKWLGDVPEHWEVMRLRNVADMRVSNVDKHVKDDENPVRLCNYVDVYNSDYINKRMGFMHATATNEEIERFRLERDDVLITKDSETWDDIGVPALVTESAYDLISGYHLALLRPRPEKLSGAYLLRALQSKGLAYQFHVEAKGVTRYGLSHGGITSVWLPLPSSSEQTAIVRFLVDATTNLDKAVAHTRRQIGLLKEYRTRLIADVVTGKVDVRGIVDKLPDTDSIADPDVDSTVHDGPGIRDENRCHVRV